MEFLWIVAAFVAGYVAAVFTWQKFHTALIGAEAKIMELREQARALQQRMKGP